MHERTLHEDFITEAVKQGAGLEAECYELSVLTMFRCEYIAALDDGETVLSEYDDKAPRITQAIDELTGEDSQKVWECVCNRDRPGSAAHNARAVGRGIRPL